MFTGPQLPSLRMRRRWAMRIMVVWAQVFVVLPAVHLHEHGHHHEAHHAEHDDHDDHHDQGRADDDHATDAHADHDAHSAAHLNAAILPTTPTLLSVFHRIPAERSLRAAPTPLDQARAGHGWTPRGPPV